MRIGTTDSYEQVTLDAASNDQAASKDLEILLETRGLIRYACFRIRRARRMREQQSATQSAHSSPSKIPTHKTKNWGQINGALDRLRDSDLQSSTTTLDAYEDDGNSSGLTSMGNYQMREDNMTEITFPTKTTEYKHGDHATDGLGIRTPQNGDIGYMESQAGTKPSASSVINAVSSSQKRDHAAGQAIYSEPSETQQHARNVTTDQESGSIEGMINTMEEDVNTLLFQMFSFIYEILLSIWSAVSHAAEWSVSRIVSLSDNRAFQGIALALLSLRLMQALAASTQDPVIATAVAG